MSGSEQLPPKPLISTSAAVPIFNCVLNVGKTAEGEVVAKAANLAGIEGRGASEREALAQAVATFKQTVSRLHTAGEPIPWLVPNVPLAAGETQRLVAVHL